jgi:hypothetical protein
MLTKILGLVKKTASITQSSPEIPQKFAFVHIPKTAGVTMSAILEQRVSPDKICPYQLYQDLVRAPREELGKYTLFRGHFPYDVLSYLLGEPFTCITVLREPVARYYSYYKFLKKREDTEQSPYLAKELPEIRKMDFKTFATATHLALVKDGLNQQCRYLGRTTPTSIKLPYMPEKRQPTPEEVERAKTRLSEMAAFGLAERFQDSLFLMSFNFGWNPVMDTLVLNASGKPDPSETLGESRKMVAESNKPDMELYEFALNLFETRYQTMLTTLVTRYGQGLGIEPGAHLSPETVYQLLEKHATAHKI